MAYGHSTRAFIEDGPVEQVARLTPRARRLAPGALDEARRLELIELRAQPANDCIDFPLAL